MQIKLVKDLFHKKGMRKGLFFSAYLLLAGIVFLCLYYVYMDFPVADTLSLIKDFQKVNSVIIKLPIVSSIHFKLKLIPPSKKLVFDDFSLMFENIQTKKAMVIHGNNYDDFNSVMHFGGRQDESNYKFTARRSIPLLSSGEV